MLSKYHSVLIPASRQPWSANTYEIIALASRAFAFYYMLQCLVAISVSKAASRRFGMAVLAVVLAFITVFAVPAA